MSYEQEELERWKRDEEIRKNVEASFLNASRKDEWKKLDEFEACFYISSRYKCSIVICGC